MFIALCFLVFSCELFTASTDPDLLDKLYDEIAWANAEKLTVSVLIPHGWGTSNPAGPSIAPGTMDIRKGYEFSLAFTPDPSVVLKSWRAYSTAALINIADEILTDSDILDDPEKGVETLGIDSITLPVITSTQQVSGGTFNFTINTTTAVTLIPWCKPEPRITRTEPRSNNPNQTISRAADIVLYFNGQLAQSEGNIRLAKNAEESGIWITAREHGTETVTGNYDENTETFRWYTELEYSTTGGFHRIIINPSSNLVPANSVITVNVSGIKNTEGEALSPPHIFSWNTPSSTNGVINSLYADCIEPKEGENTSRIKIDWDTAGADEVKILYSLNKGRNDTLITSKELKGSTYIESVTMPDSNRIRDGYPTTNINEYQIFIELYVDGVRLNSSNITVWNIPGMKVTRDRNPNYVQGENSEYVDNTATVINQTTLNSALSSDTENIVLTNSFNVDDWQPVNLTNRKFYGNGHTITITGFKDDGAEYTDIGLFGIVSGGTVRDLTVQYQTTEGGEVAIPTLTTEFRFGGITGTAAAGAWLENVLTTGTVKIEGEHNIYAGGITGQMTRVSNTGITTISNVYGGLDLTVEKTIGTTTENGSIYIGGITGSMGRPGSNDTVRVEKASAVGNISVGSGESLVVSSNLSQSDAIRDYGLFVGGITGFIRGPLTNTSTSTSVDNCDYRHGVILVNSDTGRVSIGGLVGGTGTNSNIINNNNSSILFSYSHAGNIIVNKKGAGIINIGGLIGYYISAANGYIKDSFSLNHIVINSETGATDNISAGGFIGYQEPGTNVIYCYAKGNVSVFGYGAINAGGFTGCIETQNSSSVKNTNCYATGNVSAISRGNENKTLHVGGFSSQCFNVSNCYSTGDVFADKTGTGTMRVGGFVGMSPNSSNQTTIENSFATGNVTAQRSSSEIEVGGFLGNLVRNTTLKNCAALGRSITATGGSTRYAGRVYGSEYSQPNVKQNNHAFNGMKVTQSATYGASEKTDVTLSKGRGEKDGADAHEGNFRDIRFWENMPPANNSVAFNTATHGLGFSKEHWDFSTVPERGHPVLWGSDGQRMGGQ
jgi:hypothetical protein